MFQIPLLAQRLDEMSMPRIWVNTPDNSTSTHLLSYPFLFSRKYTLSCFRAVNHAAMFQAYESSLLSDHILADMLDTITSDRRNRLSKTLARFFVLDVSRTSMTTDALDQIWRRERREMLKPLRVLLGADEGEQGEDHGGVQQEFFRLVMGEVSKEAYGKSNRPATLQMLTCE